MIPADKEELEILAGEFVLGLLDPEPTREIVEALEYNLQLREAVAFWEQKFYPLSALAPPADPPADLWNTIEARLAAPKTHGAPSWWNSVSPWRWATAALAAAAAALVFYIATIPAVPPLVAGLHAPQSVAANWIATVGSNGLRLAAVGRETPPEARVFELWSIAKSGAQPRPLGVISTGGSLHLAAAPSDIGPGSTLAISVEPVGGSPTGSPTGPIVFVGVLKAS